MHRHLRLHLHLHILNLEGQDFAHQGFVERARKKLGGVSRFVPIDAQANLSSFDAGAVHAEHVDGGCKCRQGLPLDLNWWKQRISMRWIAFFGWTGLATPDLGMTATKNQTTDLKPVRHTTAAAVQTGRA